jgi:CoA-transferase family III
VWQQAWQAIGGGPAQVDFLSLVPRMPARLPVSELAGACAAACALAAAEFRGDSGRVTIDMRRVATAFTSERQLRIAGRGFTSFAPASAFFRAADGWVRTHGNYPHHLARLHTALGPDLATAIASLPALEVEERVTAAGGLAVAVRTPAEWAAHPQAGFVAAEPLVRFSRGDQPLPPRPRVLDLTRVIAGPVATRTLALLGADVLRVDSPGLPELEGQHLDTAVGKRTTLLDFTRCVDRATFADLLGGADAIVTGYRPAALERYGFEPAQLAESHPHLCIARLSAWGTAGPWSSRRGFDSLVQAATGIAVVEGSAERPGVLPAQALDHGTGYLLAAAVLRAGRGGYAEASLARTAKWLLDMGGQPQPTLVEMDGGTYAQPPFGPTGWPAPARPWGADPPRWSP